MTNYREGKKISSVPADTPIFYPHTDGKTMAASDRHIIKVLTMILNPKRSPENRLTLLSA